MPKNRPDFAADLDGIQTDVANDVGKILELANAARRAPERGGAEAPAESHVEDIPSTASPRAERIRKKFPAQAPVTIDRAMLVNVTTRLSHQTNELLTEAALRQRLKKSSPASRQDIMETAIQEWLKANGYWAA